MQEYDFTLSQVNVAQLILLIQSSSIVTALDHINVDGTAVSIFFKASLSSGDQTTLNNLISAYVYAAPINPVISQDSDGAVLARTKAAPAGYTFQMHCFEVATANLSGIQNLDYNGNPLNQVTPYFYDASGNLLTTDLSACVKSIFDFEPTYSYYIVGGHIRMKVIPTDDVRMSVIAVPDIPYSSGGSRIMIDNINLSYLTVDAGIDTDGRAAKELPYNSTYHTGKLRFIFNHPVNFQQAVAIGLEYFKP